MRELVVTVVVLVLVLGTVGQAEAEAELLVSNSSLNSILRYDGTTGAFIDAFVPGTNEIVGPGGLVTPLGLTFGPDGSLYVCSGGYR